MSKKSKEAIIITGLNELIKKKRETDRISWDSLGEIIGYSGVGVKKAIDNNSLSIIKLQELILELEITQEAELLGLDLSSETAFKNHNVFLSGKKDKIFKHNNDLKQLEEICLLNWDKLMKRENFKTKVELTAMKNVNKILDERLAIILKNIKS